MSRILFVIAHSTDDPDRAATALWTALAASEAGHDVALWLTAEGVRLGVKGVAETLREPLPRSAAEVVETLARRGVALHCGRASYARREFDADAVRPGARVVDESELARLLADGWLPVTI